MQKFYLLLLYTCMFSDSKSSNDLVHVLYTFFCQELFILGVGVSDSGYCFDNGWFAGS